MILLDEVVVFKILLMKRFYLIIFCIACFLIGFFVYPFLDIRRPENFSQKVVVEVTTKDQSIPDLHHEESYPLDNPDVIEAKKMKEEIIDHLGHNYDSLVK